MRQATPPYERLVARLVAGPNGCLEYSGARSNGYGAINVGKRVMRLAHRIAWESVNGPIPDDLCVLHRCDNPPCCNVEHLFLGTRADNNADKKAKGRDRRTPRSHCKHGHEFTPENTYRYTRKDDGSERRACKQCDRDRQAAR